MPQYKIRPGHKLAVPDPDQTGQTTNKVGGDTVELTEAEAAEYPDALDPVAAEAKAPAEAFSSSQ